MNRLLGFESAFVGLLATGLLACSGTSGIDSASSGGDVATGGSATDGGMNSSGGTLHTGGTSPMGGTTTSTGGESSSGGSQNAVSSSLGGALSSGGAQHTGGAAATGGTNSGGGTTAASGSKTVGSSATGGRVATGGAATGGSATGGTQHAGGTAMGGLFTGGTSATGGTTATGGSSSLGTGGTSAPATTGCTPGQITQTGTLLGRYGLKHFTAAGRDYIMQVNEWNSTASQVMSYGGNYFFKMTTQQASSCPAGTSCSGSSGTPTGYPSMFVGANSKNATTNSNLPKQVSSIASVLTSWTWADNGTLSDSTNNCYNATYDVWFSTSSAGEPTASAPSGGYLMVWFYKPQDAHPIGDSPKYSGVSIPGIAGTWDIWIGNNGTIPCISYVNVDGIQSMSFDLNVFIKDAVNNRPNTIQDNWYLTNVFSGFEIWRGGLGLQTTSFCVEVN